MTDNLSTNDPHSRASSAAGGTIRAWAASIAVALAFFLAIAPTLSWLEFSSGSENLVVATALEVRRTDRWLTPTLQGEPRVAKPPLATWIAAASMSRDTFTNLNHPDAHTRADAYTRLAWEARWPALLAACLMLVATVHLGRTIGGDIRTGVFSALVLGTTFMLLRFARLNTTDIHLALWVTIANAFLAGGLFGGVNRWLAAGGAGAALGLAFLSKGPVALVQSVLPVVVFIAADRLRSRRSRNTELPGAGTFATGPIFLGVALFAAVALPWFAVVAVGSPEVWQRWWVEVMRDQATSLPPGKPYAYIAFFALMMPWTPLLVAGIGILGINLCTARDLERTRRFMLAGLLVIVPIVVMTLFRDRKERYLLPLLPPAAVLAARAAVELADRFRQRQPLDGVVIVAHWLCATLVAVGFPIAGATLLRQSPAEGSGRWFTVPQAAAAAAAALLVLGGGLLARRRFPSALVVAPAVAMLAVLQPWFVWGYSRTTEGRSEIRALAELVWQVRPEANIVITGPAKRLPPNDLSIYLNRTIPFVADFPNPMTAPPNQLVVVRRDDADGRSSDGGEPFPPPGWTSIARAPRDKGWWHALAPKVAQESR